MLGLTFSTGLDSSENVDKIVYLANSKVGSLVVHITQTFPLDLHFIFWIELVPKIWVEKESAIVTNYRVGIATTRVIKSDFASHAEKSEVSFGVFHDARLMHHSWDWQTKVFFLETHE